MAHEGARQRTRLPRTGLYLVLNYRTVCIDRGSTKVPVRSAGHAILYGALRIDLVPPATRHEQHVACFERHARKGNRAVALTSVRLLKALVGTDAAGLVLQRVGGVRHVPSAPPGHTEVDVSKGVTMQLRTRWGGRGVGINGRREVA